MAILFYPPDCIILDNWVFDNLISQSAKLRYKNVIIMLAIT